MIRFECDYATGAHPKVLEKLVATNREECPGYGVDSHCTRAAQLLRDLCRAPQADIHFLVGGTQTNMTVIAAALRPHQGVICTQMGHINDHETGAVEATGHKILPVPTQDGKLTARQVAELCKAHYEDPSVEHKVQPGMVYLSHPTEMGTLYTLEELETIRRVCDQYHLMLFVDGARLVYGLAASEVTLPDLARLCDVFYLGGTKAGLLFGEAVVITNDALKSDFRYLIKQRGGMLAKGRLLGVQFEALLEDGLYREIGQKAVAQAQRLQKAFLDKGWELLLPTPTNQQFPVIPDRALETLNQKYSSCFWCKVGTDRTAVRFCTAWSTRDEDIDALIQDLALL
ncbi:threonine aldolase family protein [Pseudoflavonifractor phocaeensis]|uniref:threonine aldolase family protein n=1 Tax=Pseudoflavonifractor phocaeensis TaxID=1870988 RepID=UPI001F31B545|nr:aminotransferase class I/II-fold pyridoxal phosphate-dependent enzyme [Pseudoflavonifractor phocaeensis]MCF2662640.1 aminotransferase class I/II-fold pyridoxal phosphate-dependent enzyme [Pseudoflavonifractor phocaeensis]